MSFAPYHRFVGCTRLENTIEGLRQAGGVPINVHAAYSKYHFSLVHKLQSARYHVETLESYLRTQNAQQMNPHAVVYRVNFHFDGFLHVLGSALDILAREVLAYYAINPAGNVYYQTAHAQLTASRAGDAILPLLTNPTWRSEFADYRNTATHESIIGTSYTIQIEVVGNQSVTRVVFPVPDDPRAVPPVCRRNPDIARYCNTTFKRVLSHTNQIYEHLEARARASGALPL